MGAGVVGRRGSRYRREDSKSDPRGPPQRNDVPRRPARSRTVYGSRAPSVGHRRSQQPYQHLLGVGTTWLRTVVGEPIAPARIMPTRVSFCCFRRTWNRATTSTRTRNESSKASWAGAKLAVMDPRLSNTASVADEWMPTWPGSEAGGAPLDRPHPSRREPLRSRVCSRLGQLARLHEGGHTARNLRSLTRSSPRSSSTMPSSRRSLRRKSRV